MTDTPGLADLAVRRAGRPGVWKKVHLTFDDLALILLQTLNDTRNSGARNEQSAD